MCLEFEIITPMSVQIFIAEVFQIKVLDGLVHSFGSCQKNLFAQICAMARALMVVQVFRSLYCLRVQMSTPMNEQNSVHW